MLHFIFTLVNSIYHIDFPFKIRTISYMNEVTCVCFLFFHYSVFETSWNIALDV
jgi:hypothetical protein